MIDIKRRELLLSFMAVGAGFVVTPGFTNTENRKKLKILVLGGTGFIGPHIVRRALARGHEVTLFNRGRSNTELFPEVEKLVGDRDGDLESLKNGQWDAVLDNTGYVPRHVRDSAELLKDRVGRYLFTSTGSVYDLTTGLFPWAPGSKLIPWSNPDSEDVGEYYGEFKAQCERIVEEVYTDRATLVRPTYIAGPGDSSQRFTWWVERIFRGGDVLAPGNPDTSFDIIDVRDLAAFYIHLLEDDRSGVFNASGPAGRFSFGGMLNGIRAATSKPVNLHWVDTAFLAKHDVNGREMPMWTDIFDGITQLMTENQSSIDVGLTFKPFVETVTDTLAWHRQLPQNEQAFTRAGIDPKKEAKVLAAWHEHQLAVSGSS
jgi:2'-hydroxyisoflavone reductase